jgi:hypothetical protein
MLSKDKLGEEETMSTIGGPFKALQYDVRLRNQNRFLAGDAAATKMAIVDTCVADCSFTNLVGIGARRIR